MKLKEGKEMKDQIMELIDMCNSQKDTSTITFLREVLTVPELSLVLANERQLDDIERFGTRLPFTVLGVDPTLNICDYNVTITTYRHPLLLDKNDDIHPVMLGPILIHTNKSFESYFTLPRILIRLRPSYTSLKAFGTDGELNVYSAFKSCFNKAQNLLCWIHAKENIENKLSKLQVKDKNIYMEETFGKTSGNIKIKGLLDCFEENEFLAEWKNLVEKWKKRGVEGYHFLKYLTETKKDLMKSSMIVSVRKRCGLGDPPKQYDQNADEAMNSVVKKSKGKGMISVKETIKLLHQEVKSQEEKLKTSLIERGEWQLKNEVKSVLQITEQKYASMNSEMKISYIQQLGICMFF